MSHQRIFLILLAMTLGLVFLAIVIGGIGKAAALEPAGAGRAYPSSAGSQTAPSSAARPLTLTVTLTRVSIASDGTQGNDDSWLSYISADGRYVAFTTEGSSLVPVDTNGQRDVFVHDQQAGQTSRVSDAWDGSEGNGMSDYASLSADGRYVAFQSEASNLVQGDMNGERDIYVHDRQTGQTSRVSVASDGTEANGWSGSGSISADGRYVAFVSQAANLVLSDTNGVADIFVHDRQTGQTSRVSVASDGTEGNGASGPYAPAVSADGRYVAFESEANNLVPNDTNNPYDVDIFVHDRQTGQTTRVSVASDGTQSNAWSSQASISADGRFVAYVSGASNLVPGDTNGVYDTFVHDQQTGQTTRVSVSSDGTQGNAGSASWSSSLSADGRFVAFQSEATNLVPGDTNGESDIFVHDQLTGHTIRISLASDGTQGNGRSSGPTISANGSQVAFYSQANNLVPGDTNGWEDVFVAFFGQVAADFAGAPLSGTAPLSVTFSNGSSGVLDTCLWQFGDGGTSGDCGGPLHEYDAAGVYSVSLSVSGPGGTDTLTKTDYIRVYEPINANFSAFPLTGPVPLLVTFNNLSTGDYDSCAWYFGDGLTSTLCSDVAHVYTAPGVYTVTLTVQGPGGTSSLTRPGYIIVRFQTLYLPTLLKPDN